MPSFGFNTGVHRRGNASTIRLISLKVFVVYSDTRMPDEALPSLFETSSMRNKNCKTIYY
jgi:hypothetical protein